MADLEELYREIILDHYRSPRNRGELESPPAHRVEGFNPLCGDEVVVSLLVEDGKLADLKVGVEVFVQSRVTDGTALAKHVLVVPAAAAS